MTQTLTEKDRYVSDFEAFEASAEAEAPDWLRRLRREAIDRFQEVGLPTARKGNEPWKYTNIAPIARTEFVRAPAPSAPVRMPAAVPDFPGWRKLVFVNGRYAPDLSNPGVDIIARSLRDVIRSDGANVQKHLGAYVDWKDDGFASLNTAFVEDGAYVELAPETVLDEPLHIVYLSEGGDAPSVSWPRTVIVAGAHSQVSLVETYASTGDSVTFSDAVTEIVLEDGAHVDHYRLLLENHASYHVGKTRVLQKRDTSFYSLAYEAGTALGRNDFSVLLDDEGSESHVNGLYVTSGTQHIDNYINIDHAKPHSTSRLYFKGILDDKSRAAFGGMVLVRPGAMKTDSHQEDKNLLLSDEAEVDSKPSLEIYADDVICGHGATAGAVTDEALFYMRSRGLDDETAQVLLVKGFANEVLERVRIEPLREHLEQLTLEALPRFRDRMEDDDS